VSVESQAAREGEAALPRRREPDLTGLATFTLDAAGRVTSWSVTAEAVFGLPAAAVTGHDVGEVLFTGPGQRELVDQALAETAAGRLRSATVAGGRLGEGRFAMRWEPLGDGALVIAAPAWPQPAPSWLSEAAARFGSSLDLAETASVVTAAAVPWFADAAFVYAAERLLAADELTSVRAGQGVAAAGRASAVRRLAARLAGRPANTTNDLMLPSEVLVLGPGTPAAQAMATGSPVLFNHIDGETAERLARYPGARETAESYTSYLAMPLIARGVVVGCAIFARGPASPAFNLGDISLADELASRAAVCIDNARLYDRERRTARALQQGLLPSQPRIPDGLEVAQVYLPVGASVIGGDWHDIVPQSSGRAALIVGDAMGHGPEAAAVMVQLRTAAHTLADLELPPVQVLAKLDKMAAEIAAAPFATCIYVVIDPPSGRCEIAQAGHLPAALVQPGGQSALLDLPPGLPLGLAAESFHATQVSLPPGATLALYTDGLVESRARPLDAGLAALGDALGTTLASPTTTLSTACHTITQALRQHGEDDITLLLARIRHRTSR
jgi:GAF domain-containing protein